MHEAWLVDASPKMMTTDLGTDATSASPRTEGPDTVLDSSDSSREKITESGNGDELQKDFIPKRLTLSFRNLTVRVTAADEALGETLWSRADPRQVRELFNWRQSLDRVG